MDIIDGFTQAAHDQGLDPVEQILKAADLPVEIVNTGGHCMVAEIAAPDGWYLWFTANDFNEGEDPTHYYAAKYANEDRMPAEEDVDVAALRSDADFIKWCEPHSTPNTVDHFDDDTVRGLSGEFYSAIQCEGVCVGERIPLADCAETALDFLDARLTR